MKKVIKIGTNKGVARLWLEGKALEAHGWVTGTNFVAEFKSGYVVYERVIDGTPRARKVAGKEGRPVIDTNSGKILEHLGHGTTHAEVHISDGNIMFTPTTKPDTKFKSAVTAALLIATAISIPFIPKYGADAKKVLVVCEESGRVRDSFNQLGHDAVSVDLMDSESPDGWHIKDDARNHIHGDWDLVIAFTPCPLFTNSAAWAFNEPNYDRYPGVGYHQKVKPTTLTGQDRRDAREEAFAMFMEIYNSNDVVSMENPSGTLSTLFRKPDQIIQPYQFGHAESKTTCLWLKGLAPLEHTKVLDIEEYGWLVTKGKHAGIHRWMNQTASGQSNMGPSADRDIKRSKTYHGVAAAMAHQWGGIVS
tara:strand:+ start:3491 stop:4579 length:1089 start_codon:yes stop_codon:yes gene_type:complete